MLKRYTALAALLLIPAASAQNAPTGQIILDNSTSLDADLFVDGEYACHAPSHSDCVAETPSGIHVPMILFANGDYIMGDPIDVPGGMSMTLPVQDLMT